MADPLIGSAADGILRLWDWAWKEGGLIVTFVGAGLGAYVGGAKAFSSEREKRELDERRNRTDRVLRTVLDLYRIFEITWEVRNRLVRPVSKESYLSLILEPIPERWSPIHFDFGAVAYLSGVGQAGLLRDLQLIERQHKALLGVVEQRRQMYDETILPILRELPPFAVVIGMPTLDAATAASPARGRFDAVQGKLSAQQQGDLNNIAAVAGSLVDHLLQLLPTVQSQFFAVLDDYGVSGLGALQIPAYEPLT